MEFIRIPRSLIYDKELGDKRILVYSSMLFTCWSSKCCTVNKLIDDCDFVRGRVSSGVEKQFKTLIGSLIEKGFVSTQGKLGDTFSFCIKAPINSFGIINRFEYDDIIQYRIKEKANGKRINHSHILLLLSYIRLNMDKRTGKPIMHFSMLKTISDNIGLSVRSVTAALKILEELSIIHSEELPRYQDKNNNWHSNVKVFVNIKPPMDNTNYDWRDETAKAIDSIICSQRDFIGG